MTAPRHRTLGRFSKEQKETLRRSELMDELSDRGPCPTPRKVAYPSRKHAKLALKHAKGDGGAKKTCRPYLCPCGRWHNGNTPSVQELQRIRENR